MGTSKEILIYARKRQRLRWRRAVGEGKKWNGRPKRSLGFIGLIELSAVRKFIRVGILRFLCLPSVNHNNKGNAPKSFTTLA